MWINFASDPPHSFCPIGEKRWVEHHQSLFVLMKFNNHRQVQPLPNDLEEQLATAKLIPYTIYSVEVAGLVTTSV